jgi:hypothetical protein
MRVVIEAGAQREANGLGLETLRVALESATFADACCVGEYAGPKVYLQCPFTKHGLLVDTELITPSVVGWVLATLERSVATSPS